jgi:hypothetical protein
MGFLTSKSFVGGLAKTGFFAAVIFGLSLIVGKLLNSETIGAALFLGLLLFYLFKIIR